MKKNLYALLSLFTFLVCGSVFFWSQAQAIEIGDIVIRFCDEQGNLEKQTSFEIDPLETKSVCLKVFNTSDEEANVQLAFVDWTVTKDESKYKACLTANDTKNFWKFASIEDSLVTVPPKNAVETSFTLKYPSGYAGMSYGCVVSKVLTDAVDSQDGMMSVELRQWHFIDVFVNGTILLDVLFDIVDTEAFPSSFIELNHSKFSSVATSSARIVNSGNIAQDVVVRSSVSGWFGFVFKAEEQTVRLNPGESRAISNELHLPWYGLGIDVHYSASATPVFEFDSSVITDEMRQTKELWETISVFLMPYWLLLCIALVLIVLVIISYRKKHNFVSTISKTVSTPKKSKKVLAKKNSTPKSAQKRTAKKSVVKESTTSTKMVTSSKKPATKIVKKGSIKAKKAKETKKTVKKPAKKTVKKNSKK